MEALLRHLGVGGGGGEERISSPYIQDEKRLTDIENRLMLPKGIAG